MKTADFEAALFAVATVEQFDEYLRAHLREIRPLFYGLTSAELKETRFRIEDIYERLDSSRIGGMLRVNPVPPSIHALLLFFLSFFERAGFYPLVPRIASLMPPGSIQSRAEAIFRIKNITDSSRDYTDRFEQILKFLSLSFEQAESEGVRTQCLDILRSYFADAVILPQEAKLNLRPQITALFSSAHSLKAFPILRDAALQSVLSAEDTALRVERTASRSRIVESLHEEACMLVPSILFSQHTEETQSSEGPQGVRQLPPFLIAQLHEMGAENNPQPKVVKLGLEADDARNRIYLGTYFPRTYIESTNIISEVTSLLPVRQALAKHDTIRILDIGSGTGGALVGTIDALLRSNIKLRRAEVTSLDGNQDALAKQDCILKTLASHHGLDLASRLICRRFNTTLDGFVEDFDSFARCEKGKFDIILIWKCLCEFYNTNYAQASGIITNALRIVSRMLSPEGIAIVLDLTSIDNRFEYFSKTLNREANDYDMSGGALMTTILPMPCARRRCQESTCFTQRRFTIDMPSGVSMVSKVAYRAFAHSGFADKIISAFGNENGYRVNAASPLEACCGGRVDNIPGEIPCGFTAFSTRRK